VFLFFLERPSDRPDGRERAGGREGGCTLSVGTLMTDSPIVCALSLSLSVCVCVCVCVRMSQNKQTLSGLFLVRFSGSQAHSVRDGWTEFADQN